MCKSKVQPLIAFIRCVIQIVQPLLLRHGIPFLLPDLILPHIIPLGKQEQRDGQEINPNQDTVAPMVKGLVIRSVDIITDDIADLHKHVVHGRGHGSRANGTRVLGCPGNNDGVAVRIAQPGHHLRAMMQGRVQMSWIMEMKVRSPTRSLSQVMPRRVITPATSLGITRRFVLNYETSQRAREEEWTRCLTVLNPSCRRVSVR